MKTLIKNNFLIILVIILSFSIRLYRFNSLSLFSDEIDVGYQAYSLLTTGKDYKGNFLPFYLDSFTESRAPLYIYSVVPSVAIFGLNGFALRFPSLIFAILSIYFLYLLVKETTNNKNLAIISAIILSLTPWHYHYSRTAFEVSLLLFLIISATYFFYKFIHTSKFYFSILSIILFALTFYTYNTANIFVPLFSIFLLITNAKTLKNLLPIKKFLSLSLFALILIFPIISNILSGSASNRFNLISIFSDPKAEFNIVNKRTDFTSSDPSIERIYHNKLSYFSNSFFSNYFSTLSFKFLFFSGDPNPRHTPTDTSPFLPVLILPLLLGLFIFHKSKKSALFYFWLLIAPLSSALTQDGAYHATRNFILLPPLIVFISSGIQYIYQRYNKFIVTLIFIPIFLYQLFSFTDEYFGHYPKSSFQYWNTSYQSLFQSIPQDFNHLYISHTNYNSLLPYLFYQQYPPYLVQTSNFSDKSVKLNDNLDGFNLNDKITFFTSITQPSLSTIQSISAPNDVFLLFQNKDIPGDMILNSNNFSDFTNLNTVYLPNQQILGQLIQKL